MQIQGGGEAEDDGEVSRQKFVRRTRDIFRENSKTATVFEGACTSWLVLTKSRVSGQSGDALLDDKSNGLIVVDRSPSNSVIGRLDVHSRLGYFYFLAFLILCIVLNIVNKIYSINYINKNKYIVLIILYIHPVQV